MSSKINNTIMWWISFVLRQMSHLEWYFSKSFRSFYQIQMSHECILLRECSRYRFYCCFVLLLLLLLSLILSATDCPHCSCFLLSSFNRISAPTHSIRFSPTSIPSLERKKNRFQFQFMHQTEQRNKFFPKEVIFLASLQNRSSTSTQSSK